MLQTLIQPNGSGSWLLGYLPVRVASGGYVLQSKYFFEQGDAHQETPAREGEDDAPAAPTPATATTTADAPPSLPPFSSLPSFPTTHVGREGDSAADAEGVEDARRYSKHCARLMMETAVRVVELRPHPLGRGELVAVLEFVHNNHWSANTRFVSLDVFKVGQAILLAGQPPPHFLSKLDILGKMVTILFMCFIKNKIPYNL